MMRIKVKVCSAIFIQVCMFYANTRPRYQVRVYRTIGPLVNLCNILELNMIIFVLRESFVTFNDYFLQL